ncbi:MAG: tetratricopeptide repeat protein [Polyangiales bacterium]
MSVENIRKLLGSLLDDPEDEKAWSTLEERAISGDLGAEAAIPELLSQTRTRLADRGEAEAVARLLDVEAELAPGPDEKVSLLRERARVLEYELLDDRAAIATLDRLLALANDPDAADRREELGGKKARWKEVAAAFKRHAENDSTDPNLIASHLVSAAGVVLQYKGKGRDKEADAIFEQALAVDPGNVRATQLYERVLRRRGGRWDDLVALLERSAEAVTEPSARIDLLLRAARTHAARRNDLDAAVRIYRAILEIDPSNDDATRFIVAILTEREAWDDLVAVYEHQLLSRPNDLGLLVQAGMIHWRTRGDVAAAAPYFRRLCALDPSHAAGEAFFAQHAELREAAQGEGEAGGGHGDDDVEVALDAGADEEIDEAVAQQIAEEEAMLAGAAAAEASDESQRVTVEPQGDEAPAEAPEAPPTETEVTAEARASEPEFIRDSMLPAAPSVPAPRVAQASRPQASDRVQQSVELALAAESAGQVERAIEAWRMVLRQDPRHADARARLAELYELAGRWNNLVELCRQEIDALGGVRPGPTLMENRERKLELLRRMVEIYRDHMNLEPMVVQTWVAVLALEPSDATALVALAESYEKLGRFTDVIKVLEQQAEHTADVGARVDLLRRVSSLWLERFNNVNNATRPLEQVLELDPTNAEAIALLKDLYGKRRAWRPLFDVSRREVELLSGQAKRDALVELARLAAEKLSAPGESISLWREALALDPMTPGALDALERLTEREKDFAGLAEVLERRVEESTDPEQRLNTLMKLGVVYSDRLEDPARSIDAWQRALSARPGHPKAMRVLRDAYTSAGDWDELEALYAAANDYEGLAEVLGAAAERSADPATKIALSFRAAKIYVDQLAQPERAFRSYERVLSVDPKNLEATDALLPIYLKDEKWPRLAQLYEVRLEALPEGETERALDLLLRLRELASTRLGDRPGAFRWALKAYLLNPDDAELEAGLERAAADAGAWRELVATYDARIQALPADQRARLRDKAATLEADKLHELDAAISRYQAALAEAPGDEEVISTLDRLYRRAARWSDLRAHFNHRIEHAGDPVTRRALRMEAARLEEGALESRDDASARLREVLADDPADVEALEALSRLAELAERWPELASLVASRRDLASGAPRADLAYRLGQIRAERLGDLPGAIESFREVLSLSPHHPDTLASLETLLGNDDTRVEVARILEPEFEAISEHRKLAWTLQILLEAEGDAERRQSLALRLAEVYAERLGDGQSAFDLLSSTLEAQPGSEAVADALTALSLQRGWGEDLASRLAAIASREELPSAVRVALARRTASIYDDRLGDAAAAEPFHRTVVDSGALDLHAFGALKRFLQQQERWDDLRALYAAWIERTPEVPAKIELLDEEAALVEEVLDQPAEAAALFSRILELDAQSDAAMRSLDRLYVRLGRWRDAEELLTRRVERASGDADETRGLILRRGELRERHLDALEGALDDYARVLDDAPTDADARAGIERILAHAPLRRRAAETLEARYEADGDVGAGDLVRMLAVRLEFTEAPSERARLHQRIAELREIVLDDAEGALTSLVAAMEQDPGAASLRGELLRLSAVADADARAAEALERAANDPRVGAERVSVLRDLAGLYDERIHDPRAAERTWRRLLEDGGDDVGVSIDAATALERIYRGLGEPKGLVEALSLRARLEADPDSQGRLLAQAAEILEESLGDFPAAIASHRSRLEIDPSDRDALRSLQRLHERTSQWSELVSVLRREAELTADAAEQKSLVLRAAAVLEERLADVPGSIALYNEALDTFGPDRAVHASLARLYELSDAWPELLAVLERDLEVADDSDRLGLIVRAAELRRTKTGDLARAVEGYREALDLDLASAAARDALWSLLSSTEPGIALASARALDPVLQGDGSWEKLVTVLDRVAADSDDFDERRQALARAAEVSELGIGDSGRAFDYAARELAASMGDADLRSRIDRVAELAKASSREDDLIEVLSGCAPDLVDAELQRDVQFMVAGLARTSRRDLDLARAWYEKALETQPDHMPALDALESLHEERSAWPELLAVLRTKTDLSNDEGVRRDLLRKQAEISEARTNNAEEAIAAHEAILGMSFDLRAARALERLYADASRWDDLCALLETQLGLPESDEAELHYRLGAVSMDRLDAPERALEHFREALARQSDHDKTIEALERLGAREGFAASVAETLEPIYLARVEWPKLIAALEARLAAEDDVSARKELYARLGTIYEENLGDLAKALETYARMFRDELSDRDTWDTLARLARQLGRWDRLAEIYREALDAVSVDDDVTAELAFLAAQVLDERVHDTAAARTYFHRALSFNPTRGDVFAALEALLKREAAHTELLTLYRDAADRAGDPDERKRFQFLVAEIDEGPLHDLPQAIEDYRAILDTDPFDAEAVNRLDALLIKTESWVDLSELLERRVLDAVDSDERSALRFRLGRLRADKLNDPEGAVGALRDIVEERRDHEEAIRALEGIADAHPAIRLTVVEILEPIYRDLDDWNRLIVALNIRTAASTDLPERTQLLREVGSLRETRAKDVKGAFSAYAQAFTEDAGDGEAREALERLAAEHNLWDDLVRAYETAVAASDDVAIRADLLRAIAQTHDQRRDDPRSAIDAYNRLFALDDSQVDVLDLLEGLHVLLSDWQGHIDVLELKAARTLDDEHKKFLLHTIGDSQRDMLSNLDGAIDAFRRALETDPTDIVALDALDGLYSQRGDARALSEVLGQRLDIETDPEIRCQTALRLGSLWETELGSVERAVDAYRRALDDAPTDAAAIASLERLYTRQEAWDELLDNLRLQVSVAEDAAARVALQLRVGDLLAQKLSEPDAALDAYRDVLDASPDSEAAIAAVKALAREDAQRQTAVEILEPIFRASGRSNDLVEVLELKLEAVSDPMQRLVELRGLALVHEDGRSDAASAFETYRRALHEDPADRETAQDLERLAASLDRWGDVVDAMEREAEDSTDGTVIQELSVRAAELSTERLSDDVRATRNYCRALEQAGDDDAILRPLDVIYTRSERWRDLLDVLERRIAVASGDDLDALEVRAGDLREKRFSDAPGALSAYRSVLDRVPTNAEALAGLERLLVTPDVRADALEALESAYQRTEDHARLAWVIELRVSSAEVDSDRVRLLGDLARIREERLGDMSGALDAWISAFNADPGDESIVTEIERLAPAADAWSRLAGVVEAALEAHPQLGALEQSGLSLRAARWYRDQLGDPARAEARLLAVLELEPESAEALEMLEGLRRVPGREADLVATLQRRAEVSSTPSRAPRCCARRRMYERTLADTDLAADPVTRLLEGDDTDVEALAAPRAAPAAPGPSRRGRRGHRARARLTGDPAEALALRREVAEISRDPRRRRPRRGGLPRDPRLDPSDLSARVALEGIFERNGSWKDLEDALRGRLDVAVSATERAETNLRLAALAEREFHNLSDAADYLRLVIDETPTHEAAGRELERIFAAEARWMDLTDLLERRAEHLADANDLAGELATLVRIGELNERELRDPSRALELYERVLDRDADHVGALQAVARIAEAEGQWSRAAEALRRALALAPSDASGADLALRLARIEAQHLHEPDAAVATARRGLELDPGHAETLDWLKRHAEQSGDHALLAFALERELDGLTDARARVATLRSLATLNLEKLGEPAHATAFLEDAHRLAPEDREVAQLLLTQYEASERSADAIPILNAVIGSFGTRRTKELASWQHRLGRALEATGEDAQALATYDAAFKVDLTSVPILRDLGLICLRLGDLERAQKTFRALLLQRLDGSAGITKADVYFHLGETLTRQGDKPKAISMVERALEADRGHAGAAALLESLKS